MIESQKQLDTRAIEIAKEALTRIDAHEKLANTRYGMIEKGMQALFDEIRGQNRRWLVVSGAIISGLVVILGGLVTNMLLRI